MEQLEFGDKDIKYTPFCKEDLTWIIETLKPSKTTRNITIQTGEFGMHEFNFNVLSTSMGIKSSYLKTSNNYGGHILDGINKVYFRWRANNVQYFIAKASNNKILSIHDNITKALEWHKKNIF